MIRSAPRLPVNFQYGVTNLIGTDGINPITVQISIIQPHCIVCSQIIFDLSQNREELVGYKPAGFSILGGL